MRPIFRRDRRLLGELCRCAWQSFREYVQASVGPSYIPGAIFAIQTYGDSLNWHPHLHALASDVVWSPDGASVPIGRVDSGVITQLFQHQVLEMMVSRRRLSREFAQKLRSWQHSGFQVHCSRSVAADQRPALERLAAYLLRPRFAGTRVRYDPDHSHIEYRTAKGVTCSLDALDWIARVTSHIPAHHEQMVRYNGRYSNAARGKRRKQEAQPALYPSHGEPPREEDAQAESCSRERRRSWARLLRKIYEVDPLTCPRCGSLMEIISSIEQPHLIRRILRHLNLWERHGRSPPPRLFPRKLQAFLANLSPRQAQQLQASSDSLFWDEVPVFEG